MVVVMSDGSQGDELPPPSLRLLICPLFSLVVCRSRVAVHTFLLFGPFPLHNSTPELNTAIIPWRAPLNQPLIGLLVDFSVLQKANEKGGKKGNGRGAKSNLDVNFPYGCSKVTPFKIIVRLWIDTVRIAPRCL